MSMNEKTKFHSIFYMLHHYWEEVSPRGMKCKELLAYKFANIKNIDTTLTVSYAENKNEENQFIAPPPPKREFHSIFFSFVNDVNEAPIEYKNKTDISVNSNETLFILEHLMKHITDVISYGLDNTTCVVNRINLNTYEVLTNISKDGKEYYCRYYSIREHTLDEE